MNTRLETTAYAAITAAMLLSACTQVTTTNASNDDTAGGSSSTPTSALGEPCESNADCGDDAYCHQLGYGCNGGFGKECRSRPTTCEEIYEPACACDGEVYDNECLARAAGQSVVDYNRCVPPTDDLFACGSGFCERGAELCVEEFEIEFRCEPLPDNCLGGRVSCGSCFPDEELPGDCHGCYDEGGGEDRIELFCGIF